LQALQLTRWGNHPELREIAVPEPGPGEVLIRIGGAGACQSDLHLMEWPAGMVPWKLPFTLGHENAGWVEALGPGASGFSVGDPVVLYGPWGCGRCRNCLQGMENYCENAATHNAEFAGGGLGLNGGMADYMLVPSSRYLVPLTTLEPRDAAPLTDAGLTSYRAIKRSFHLLGAKSSAAVIGVGGLGHMAIQILKALSGTQVIAIDMTPEKLELAREVGADQTVLSGPEAHARIRDLTHGRGADLVLDFVGSKSTLELAAKVAAVLGNVNVVGQALGNITWNYIVFPHECSVATTYWGSLSELLEVIALAESGRLKSHNTFYSLAQHEEVYEAMKAGLLPGRAVFIPDMAV